MKFIQFITLILSIASITTACHKNLVKASGNVVEVEKTVSDFTKLDVSHAFDVTVNYSDTEELVVVEADDNLQDYIIVEVENDELTIRLKENLKIRRKETLRVHITTKELNIFEASGASTITLNNELIANEVKVDLSGASDFTGTIEATTGEFEFSGASDGKLTGSLNTAKVTNSGASVLKSYGLHADILHAEVSGASSLQLTVNNELNVVASGASNVKYKGSGVIVNQELSGASSIRKED